MKDLLELVRNRYAELSKRLKAAKEEESKYDSERERLALEFTISDNAYNDACDNFERIEKRIAERKEKYTKKEMLTNKKTLISTLGTLATLTIGTCMLFGAITNPLFLPIVGSFTIASLIDLKISWKKMKKEAEEKFEEEDSTQRTREISDKAYVIKIQREKEVRDIQWQIIENTRNLNLAKSKRISIENEITNTKLDTFDLIVDEKTEAESLILRK